MRKLFRNILSIAMVGIFAQFAFICYADTCYQSHKRALVKSICGQIDNPIGERPEGVRITVTYESTSAHFSVEPDAKGKFDFGPLPKGDYLLRATAPGYTIVERQLRVTSNGEKNRKPKIDIRLGFRSCDGGVYVKGFDKKNDLVEEKN